MRGAGAGSRGAAHLSTPLSTSPSTAAPTYADISFIASCVSLQPVSFALGSCSCPLFLPLSTSFRSLIARLLAHFPTLYSRGIQPSSENTTKTGSIYDNTARPPPIWRCFPGCLSPSAAPPLEPWARPRPHPPLQARLWAFSGLYKPQYLLSPSAYHSLKICALGNPFLPQALPCLPLEVGVPRARG